MSLKRVKNKCICIKQPDTQSRVGTSQIGGSSAFVGTVKKASSSEDSHYLYPN